VIIMTRTRSTHLAARAHRPAGWRAACRVAAAMRDFHHQQLYALECLSRGSRAAVDRPGPLAWTPSLDGPRLTGTWLTD
jgi:hypothetical protein